jgi:hypothetical protein
MERSARNAHLTALQHVEVREGDGQLIVLVAHRRAEEERGTAIEIQPKARQVARAVMVQTLLAESAARDIAAVIEDGKSVAVLENASSVGHPSRGSDHRLSDSSSTTSSSMTHRRPDIALSSGSYIHGLGLRRCSSSVCAALR